MSRFAAAIPRVAGGTLGIAAAIAFGVGSTSLPFGNTRVVGPGATSLVLSVVLGALSVALALSPLRRDVKPPAADERQPAKEKGGSQRIAIVLSVLGLFVLTLGYVGFLVAGFLLMYTLYSVGQKRVLSLTALVAAVATIFAAYVLFILILGVRLPTGEMWGR